MARLTYLPLPHNKTNLKRDMKRSRCVILALSHVVVTRLPPKEHILPVETTLFEINYLTN